jgi:hypothetical protein
MAERLATLPGLIPRPGWRPAISVKKVALICNPASGRRSQALQLRLYMGLKFAVAKAKVFPHLEAWVRVGQGILHLKHSLSLLMVQYSKDTHAIKKTLKKKYSRLFGQGIADLFVISSFRLSKSESQSDIFLISFFPVHLHQH